MIDTRLATGIFFFLLASALTAQNKVINAHGMAYYEKERRMYVFGGATEDQVSNALWVVDGNAIQQVETSTAPDGRTFPSIVYHEKEEALFLFGGSRVLFGTEPDPNNLKNDSWLFKEGKWQQLHTSNSPKPRAHASISYDRQRNRVVLFGGYDLTDGNYIPLGDTWEFYNGDWHLVAESGPSARIGAAMVYDSENHRSVLFGGSTVAREYGPATGETWTWNGKHWQKLEIEQPPNAFDANMAYDRQNDRIVRFGGWTGKSRSDETWFFEDGQWIRLDGLQMKPLARNHSQLVYDEANERMILFGGHNGTEVFGDLWFFAQGHWQQVIYTKPQKRVRNRH